jgi:polyisoprenoid-binding protein YceI
MRPLFLALSAALALAAITGCEDPAKNKAKAVATEAQPVTAQAAGADYVFDQSNSKLDWTGSKVTGKHDGSFATFRGDVHVVDATPEKSSVKVDIDTSSLTTSPEKLALHLKSPDFFDVQKYPNASFVSTEVKKGGEKGATNTIVGNLTLHGVTKSITFPANVKLAGDQVAVDAEFAINRRDFGLVYPGAPNDLIRDDVVIHLNIHASKKPAS